MPTRVTLGDAKDPLQSRICNILNVPPTDSRFAVYLNIAIKRLLAKGKWVGTTQKYQVCTYGGCLTWPRQFETIEAVAICNRPINIRNEWFEFNENGWGLRDQDDEMADQLYDRGTACAFNDIHGTNKKIKVYCDIDQAPTPAILLQGYDQNAQWIRTFHSGAYVDGEYVTPTAAGALTTNFFTSLTGAQKEVTDGSIRLYEYNTSDSTQLPLAVYEPDETRPIYRRSLIAGLSKVKACAGTQDSTCDKKTVTVVAKMAFIPVRVDVDWLLIGNIPALQLMCQCLRKEENNLWDDAQKYEAKAVQVLDEELQAFMGDSEIIAMRFPRPDIYGAAVGNVI